MSPEALSRQISQLVDVLRASETERLSLVDVASVTEILIATLQSYFAGIETSIYGDCRAISESIAGVRQDLSGPSDAVEELTGSARRIETAASEILASVEGMEDIQPNIKVLSGEIADAASILSSNVQAVGAVVEVLKQVDTRVEALQAKLSSTQRVEDADGPKGRDTTSPGPNHGSDSDLHGANQDSDPEEPAQDKGSEDHMSDGGPGRQIRGRTTTQADIETLFG